MNLATYTRALPNRIDTWSKPIYLMMIVYELCGESLYITYWYAFTIWGFYVTEPSIILCVPEKTTAL